MLRTLEWQRRCLYQTISGLYKCIYEMAPLQKATHNHKRLLRLSVESLVCIQANSTLICVHFLPVTEYSIAKKISVVLGALKLTYTTSRINCRCARLDLCAYKKAYTISINFICTESVRLRA